MGRPVSYSELEARAAIAASRSFAEALRRLGMCETGGAGKTLKQWTVRWGISTDHFDPYAASRERLTQALTPLDQVLVAGSTYHRGKLKERLFQAGLKSRRCELCGQSERWHGRTMSLILDPHQWGFERQPDRQPPDRLPKLRRDAGHALRTEAATSPPALPAV